MRGLKFRLARHVLFEAAVALLVSAWIEIFHLLVLMVRSIVALLVSAWIEI